MDENGRIEEYGNGMAEPVFEALERKWDGTSHERQNLRKFGPRHSLLAKPEEKVGENEKNVVNLLQLW